MINFCNDEVAVVSQSWLYSSDWRSRCFPSKNQYRIFLVVISSRRGSEYLGEVNFFNRNGYFLGVNVFVSVFYRIYAVSGQDCRDSSKEKFVMKYELHNWKYLSFLNIFVRAIWLTTQILKLVWREEPYRGKSLVSSKYTSWFQIYTIFFSRYRFSSRGNLNG